MPKDANIVPNIRVDIPDFKQSTSVLGRGNANLQRKLVFQDQAAAAPEGYLIEVADQVASPGLFSVHNGISYDRDGQIINNEDDVDATRSATLGADATYFVEIEFVESASDVDARAFWDTTFANGAGVPSGREFSQNIATRLTPDWQIVTPISTTGFASTSDPNSTKIPVAVLTVVAGEITGGTTSPLRSVLSTDEIIAATEIRLLNTRAMPQSFTLRLNPGGGSQEDVTVTGNDQENGVLTLGAGTVNAHFAGERVIITGGSAAEFLIERVATVIPTSGTEDARPRFYQADEGRGAILGVDATGTGGDRSDQSIENLKRYVDFLAAQLREVKFGGMQNGEAGNSAPPAAFNNPPRYFEASGGVQAARTNTVSVGDGVLTFGDFNTAHSGSAQAALQAAHDALPASGGIIYLKGGTYTIVNTTVTFTKPVRLQGDPGNTVIEATGTAAALTLGTVGAVSIIDVDVLDNGSTAAFTLDSTGGSDYQLYMRGCEVHGWTVVKATAIVEDCVFDSTSTGNHALNGVLTSTTYRRCRFATQGAVGTDRCVNPTALASVKFESCTFSLNATQTALIEIPAVTLGMVFDDCTFTGNGGIGTVVNANGAGERLVFKNCVSTLDNGFGVIDGIDDFRLLDCDIEVPANGEGMHLGVLGAGQEAAHFKISGCTFRQLSSAGGTLGIGILIENGANGSISDCNFTDCNQGIQITTAALFVTIRNCFFGGVTSRVGIALGYDVGFTVTNGVHVLDCTFENIGEATADVSAGIHFQTHAIANVNSKWVIKGNTFNDIEGGLGEAFGIFMELVGTSFEGVISGNHISNVETDIATGFGLLDGQRAAAIWLSKAFNTTVADNVIQDIGNNNINFTEFQGIKIVEADDVSITGNVITNLGNATPFKTERSSGISVGGDASGALVVGPAQTAKSQGISITGNTIATLRSNTNMACIFIFNDVHGVTISGNSCRTDENNCRGVWVDTGPGVNDSVESVSITGNTFDGNFNQCVFYDLDVAATNAAGFIAITGNTGNGFNNTGIRVDGLSTNTAAVLTISGNTMRSTFNTGVEGIFVDFVRYCTISANTILLTDGAAANQYGIRVNEVNKLAITGNSIACLSTHATVRGILFGAGNPDACVSGNLIEIEGTALSSAIAAAGNDQFITGNRIVANGAGFLAVGGGKMVATPAFINSFPTNGPEGDNWYT